MTGTRLTYEQQRISVSFGWDLPDLELETQPLDLELRLPECTDTDV